jgi:lipid II:glycine glycyltransferase (peptidoglycan interpeptide bridge formation enzyme)
MIPQFETDRARWNETLLGLPSPHVLQTWEWGQVKVQTGWQASRLLWQGEQQPVAAASLLVRRLDRLPVAVAYVPKGPLLDWANLDLADEVLAGLEEEARRNRALFVKIDPDVVSEDDTGQAVTSLLTHRGWQPSREQIQFRNTALLGLAPDEAQLLAAMKSKWRYNIRLAARRGVLVHRGRLADLATFYHLYAETGQRDGFIVRPFSYYEETWRTFLEPADDRAPRGYLLLAETDQEAQVIAGLFLFCFGPRAWYMYGASSSSHRNLMPNHLLQWEAIKLARGQGCTTYDLWGAPDELNEDDPMWGVWRFKEGFGAQFTPHIGAWDYPVSPARYWSYTVLMPRVLDWMRSRRRESMWAGGADR